MGRLFSRRGLARNLEKGFEQGFAMWTMGLKQRREEEERDKDRELRKQQFEENQDRLEGEAHDQHLFRMEQLAIQGKQLEETVLGNKLTREGQRIANEKNQLGVDYMKEDRATMVRTEKTKLEILQHDLTRAEALAKHAPELAELQLDDLRQKLAGSQFKPVGEDHISKLNPTLKRLNLPELSPDATVSEWRYALQLSMTIQDQVNKQVNFKTSNSIQIARLRMEGISLLAKLAKGDGLSMDAKAQLIASQRDKYETARKDPLIGSGYGSAPYSNPETGEFVGWIPDMNAMLGLIDANKADKKAVEQLRSVIEQLNAYGVTTQLPSHLSDEIFVGFLPQQPDGTPAAPAPGAGATQVQPGATVQPGGAQSFPQSFPQSDWRQRLQALIGNAQRAGTPQPTEEVQPGGARPAPPTPSFDEMINGVDRIDQATFPEYAEAPTSAAGGVPQPISGRTSNVGGLRARLAAQGGGMGPGGSRQITVQGKAQPQASVAPQREFVEAISRVGLGGMIGRPITAGGPNATMSEEIRGIVTDDAPGLTQDKKNKKVAKLVDTHSNWVTYGVQGERGKEQRKVQVVLPEFRDFEDEEKGGAIGHLDKILGPNIKVPELIESLGFKSSGMFSAKNIYNAISRRLAGWGIMGSHHSGRTIVPDAKTFHDWLVKSFESEGNVVSGSLKRSDGKKLVGQKLPFDFPLKFEDVLKQPRELMTLILLSQINFGLTRRGVGPGSPSAVFVPFDNRKS